MINAERITKEISNKEAVLIDVRSKLEYKMGHAENAINVPVQNIHKADIPSKDTPIYVYCASGGRSGMAASMLQAKGYANVTNIGGIGNWRAMGGTIAR